LAPDAVLAQTAFRLASTDLEAVRLAAKSNSQSPSAWFRAAILEKLERDENGKV
jgi:hypothetical protein